MHIVITISPEPLESRHYLLSLAMKYSRLLITAAKGEEKKGKLKDEG